VKKFRKARILAALICALMLVQALGLGNLGIPVSAANESVFFEDDFDYDSFDDMRDTGLWDVETLKRHDRTDSLEPTLDNGVLKLRETSSVQFMWTEVDGIGNFSTNNTYTFEFDFKVTDLGDGSTWGGPDHTRALYGAMGGWYNLIEIHNKNGKIRQGAELIDYDTANVLNKTLHATIAWSNTTITTTITKEDGGILVSGSRSNVWFADMNAESRAMTYLVLKCEDGAAEISNFEFSCRDASAINSQVTTYTADITHAKNGRTVVKMDGTEIFSLNGSTLKLCNAEIKGSYKEGNYSIKVVATPLQKIMYVELTLADGGTVRRGIPCYAKPNSFSWECGNNDSISNGKKTEHTGAAARDYTLVTVEPTVQGFGSKVYNLVSSFDDPATTRLLAWTADPAFVGGADMAVKYRVKGESTWQEINARRMSEKTLISNEDYYKADITGLSAGTEYEYKIGIKNADDSAKWSKTYTFRTAKANIDSFKFVAIGDTQSKSWGGLTINDKGYTYTHAALDLAIKDAGDAAFILNAGDITDDGDDLNMWNWYFKALGDYGATVPHFATIGNHDTWSDDNNNYFSLHLNHPDNGADALDQSFSANVSNGYVKKQFSAYEDTIYSYNYGDAHFIVLNSGAYYADDRYLLEAQRQWLTEDLEANKGAKWKILMVHEPVYHRKGGSEDRPWLFDVIESYGVDLVIQGHSHLVTRTYPMLDGKIVTKESPDLIKQGTGTVYTTIGSTTLNHDSLGNPNVEACMTVISPDSDQAAYTVVSVEGDRLVMTVKQLNGYVLDEFTILATDGNADVSTDPTTNAPTEEKKDYTSVIIIGGTVALCTAAGLGAAVVIKKKKRK